MKTVSRLLIIAFCVCYLCVFLTACGNSEPVNSSSAEELAKIEPASFNGTIITSADEKISIKIPDGWIQREDLHDTAKIQASDSKEELFLMVLTESKRDVSYDFESWRNKIKDKNVTAYEGSVSEEKAFTLNGNKAVQLRMDATIDGVNFAFLITYIDGKDNYVQVFGWSLLSIFEENEKLFSDITSTILGY